MSVDKCKIVETPYGLQLIWELQLIPPSEPRDEAAPLEGISTEGAAANKGMTLVIHLKDNKKVVTIAECLRALGCN